MTAWARPFNVTRADGIVLHGAQFPSGRVLLDGDEEAGVYPTMATGMEHLELPPGSTVDWQSTEGDWCNDDGTWSTR